MPTAITVTATQGGTTANGLALRVLVLTGAAATQNGASASLTNASSTSITTTQTGSQVYGAMIGPNAASTPNGDTTQIDDIADSTNGERYATFKATSPTGTPGAITIGDTNAGCQGVALFEVLTDSVLREDLSAPAVASTTSATSVTTASFTPPGDSLLVALVSSDGGAGVTTMDVQGGGLPWTPVSASNVSGNDYCGVWIARVAPPDPGDPVITATQGGSTGPGMAMRIFVLTQAAVAASQPGGTSNTQFTAVSNFTQSVTTVQTGSRVYGASSHFPNAVSTAAALTTVVDDIADATNNARYTTFKATSLTGTPGATTLGFTVSGANAGPFAQAEIKTAGTLTEDASAPPVASTTSQTFIACANFTPPPGSLLVVLIASDGGTGITTMAVSGGGLTFTELVKNNPSAGDYAGVWVADVPAAAGGGVRPFKGGKTWNRRFRHRQRLLQTTAVAADIRSDTALGTVGFEADVTAKKVAKPTGNGGLGLTATPVARKVAVVTAISSLGLTATPVAKKVSKSTGVGTVGLASTVTAKKVSTPTALGAMGLSANFVHADVRSVTVSAPVGLTSTSTAKKVSRPTVSAPVGLVGTSTAKKVSRPILSAPVGLAGIVTAQKKVIATGLGALGLGSQHSGVTPRNVVALGGLGLTSTLAAKKRSTPISAGVLGLTGNALPKKISKSTGAGILALVGISTVRKKQAITGRSVLGLQAEWLRTPPVLFGRSRTGAVDGIHSLVGAGVGPGAKPGTGTAAGAAAGAGRAPAGRPGASDGAKGKPGGDT